MEGVGWLNTFYRLHVVQAVDGGILTPASKGVDLS
jgi:hypothetical protein